MAAVMKEKRIEKVFFVLLPVLYTACRLNRTEDWEEKIKSFFFFDGAQMENKNMSKGLEHLPMQQGF